MRELRRGLREELLLALSHKKELAMLAHNLFGDSLCEASSRLGGKTARHLL
jgi:hypothetical protein